MHTNFKHIFSKTISLSRSSPFRPFQRYSFSTQTSLIPHPSHSHKNVHSRIFWFGLATLLSSFGVGYKLLHSEKNKTKMMLSLPPIEEPEPPKLFKKDAKIIIQQAIDYDNNGDNKEALELYNIAYRVYRRAMKASNRKLTFLRQRIAILDSLDGKDKRAVLLLMEAYQRASPNILTTQMHLELYYDLCILYYRFGEFPACIKMLNDCLKVVDNLHSGEKELRTGIYQLLGFCHMRRGKIDEGEKYLTKVLQNLNEIKMDNKAFLYYACQEFSEFYFAMGNLQKALLFLEQSKVVLNQEDFFSKENMEKGMCIPSPFTRKFMKDLRLDKENQYLTSKSKILREKLGSYDLNNQKRNIPFKAIMEKEKKAQVHGLLYW